MDEDQLSLMFFSILPSPASKSCVKVGETQGMKNKVAKSEKNQLRVGESSSVFVWSMFVCLICGRGERGMEVLSCLG